MNTIRLVMSYLVLVPILPFAAVYYLGEGFKMFSAWCCEYRPWSEKLVDLSYDLYEKRD